MQKSIAVLFAAVLPLLGAAPLASAAPPVAYQLRSADGNCLDAMGNSGNTVQAWWDCNRSTAQRWRFQAVAQPAGGRQIIHAASGQCVTWTGDGERPVILATCRASGDVAAQVWTPRPVDGQPANTQKWVNASGRCYLSDSGWGRPADCVVGYPWGSSWTTTKS